MNFEQFTEEVRAANPAAGVICATEQPLTLVMDGRAVDPAPLLAVHSPCWLRLDKAMIRADGSDAARLLVDFPYRANLEVVMTLRQGESSMQESLALDANGQGELEIVSSTPGMIHIEVQGKPVRTSLQVEEI